MRKNIFITMATMVAIAFTSCSVNDEIQDNAAVRFTATVGEASAVSKAAGTTWGNGDAIGLFMVKDTPPVIVERAENQQYATTGNGTFTAAAGHEIYYPLDGSAVNFIAYYPYESGTTLAATIDVQIATEQTASNQPTFDLLYSANATGYNKMKTDAVGLTFEHKLSKLVMNCAANASVGVSLEGMTVAIKGMNTKNTFNLATGVLATASTPATLTPRTVRNGSVYEAILLPGSYKEGALTVDFKLSTGEVFTWDVGAATFEGGNEYTYAVTLTLTGVNARGTITPWKTISKGGVTAE